MLNDFYICSIYVLLDWTFTASPAPLEFGLPDILELGKVLVVHWVIFVVYQFHPLGRDD
jgi:hypothetical protein